MIYIEERAMVIKPMRLQSGDTIGIVTLASPVDPKKIDESIAILQRMGFQVVLGTHVYSPHFPASTAAERASDLMSMFANPSIKMILASRGGTGVSDILPYLDYHTICRHPKIVSGYSDLSILLNVLYQYTNLLTFHGLMLINFQPDIPPFNLASFFMATSTAVWPRRIMNPSTKPFVSKVMGNVTGRIVGGNLTGLVSSLGTPFEIDTQGKILFLEEVNEPTSTVYRLLSQLKLAGKLDDCIGIVMGECTRCQVAYETTYEDIIDRLLVPLGKPLLTNFAIGHGKYKVTLPIGALANLNTVNQTLTLLEPAVC
jgi:muramoyltetrapeptide carboxypeptidase